MVEELVMPERLADVVQTTSLIPGAVGDRTLLANTLL